MGIKGLWLELLLALVLLTLIAQCGLLAHLCVFKHLEKQRLTILSTIHLKNIEARQSVLAEKNPVLS